MMLKPRSPRSIRSRIASFAAVIAMVAAGAVLTAPAAAADTYYRPDGVNYTYDSGNPTSGATAIGCSGTCPDPMYIPDAIHVGSEAHKVVAIGDKAFDEEGLTEVDIGDNVKEIDYMAFYRNHITKLTIGNSVELLDTYAFYSNPLTSVTIPPSVVTIGYAAFSSNHLKSVTIPDSVTTIGGNAFSGNSLTSVTIGNAVTTIGDWAFDSNSGLTSVVLTGPAPTVTAAGTSKASFDTSSGSLVLTYPWQFDASQVSGGYTAGTWKGYHTQTLAAPIAVATVSFNAKGHGSAPASEQVTVGAQASKPASPSASGYTFTGWYTDSGLANKFNFNTAINGDLTLYAGWAIGGPASSTCHPFPDVSSSNVHCRNIEWLSGQGITKPADGKYHPTAKVTRGSMTAFLFRLTHPGQSSPKCTSKPYPDVSTSNVFCGYIQWAVKSGVAKGYPNGTFRPGNGVTRGAMAAFLQRIAVGHPAPKCTKKPFADVSVGSTFCRPISWMRTNKITYGVGGGKYYGTNQIVNRQSMASFLHRIYDYMYMP